MDDAAAPWRPVGQRPPGQRSDPHRRPSSPARPTSRPTWHRTSSGSRHLRGGACTAGAGDPRDGRPGRKEDRRAPHLEVLAARWLLIAAAGRMGAADLVPESVVAVAIRRMARSSARRASRSSSPTTRSASPASPETSGGKTLGCPSLREGASASLPRALALRRTRTPSEAQVAASCSPAPSPIATTSTPRCALSRAARRFTRPMARAGAGAGLQTARSATPDALPPEPPDRRAQPDVRRGRRSSLSTAARRLRQNGGGAAARPSRPPSFAGRRFGPAPPVEPSHQVIPLGRRERLAAAASGITRAFGDSLGGSRCPARAARVGPALAQPVVVQKTSSATQTMAEAAQRGGA